MASDLKEFLSTLKQKLNIIEVAGGYISLVMAAGGGLVARFITKRRRRLLLTKATSTFTVSVAGNPAT